jgi:hypothetical protein
VKFQSAASIFATCEFCRSMIVRHDLDVELIGKQASLPDDQSPLQIGTAGQFKGTRFTLQGRFRVKWSDGFWNEWFAWCDDGRTAWLAEAQGFLSFYFESTNTSALPARDAIRNGQRIDKTFTVADLKECEIVGSQGELPFRAPPGRKSLSADLNGDAGTKAAATIEYTDSDAGEAGAAKSQVRFYVGENCDFDDLKLSNLRQLDGW